MARLVVYGRSGFCPDMLRWRRWVAEHPLHYVEFDIDADEGARCRVIEWTGHESVPTLVIAADDGYEPLEPPGAIPAGRGPRAVDRGSVLSEPAPSQIAEFLSRHAIPFGGGDGAAPGPLETAITLAGVQRAWWRLW